jgi:putative N6-adenine-specific DNA methylase
VNRHSRIASRVLARLGSVKRADQLKTLRLPAKLPVRVEGGDRAWQQAAFAAWGEGDGLELSLRMHQGEVVVSVDTSGELLHMRGYRQEIGRAPMRETLAAGLLRLAKYDPALPLWDVMCGSGTIVIEAAEFAAGLAPGRNRRFAFENWGPPQTATAEPVEPRGTEAIIGSDLNAGALGTARRNAKRAGVFERLTLERLDATRLTEKDLSVGLVVANLPYGKRVGEKSELGALYRGLGASLRKACPGWRFALLLEEGAQLLGLPVQETTDVANGGLRCVVVTGKVPW